MKLSPHDNFNECFLTTRQINKYFFAKQNKREREKKMKEKSPARLQRFYINLFVPSRSFHKYLHIYFRKTSR